MNRGLFKDLPFMVRLFAEVYLECDVQIFPNYEQAFVQIITPYSVSSISLSDCHTTKECVLKCIQNMIDSYLKEYENDGGVC